MLLIPLPACFTHFPCHTWHLSSSEFSNQLSLLIAVSGWLCKSYITILKWSQHLLQQHQCNAILSCAVKHSQGSVQQVPEMGKCDPESGTSACCWHRAASGQTLPALDWVVPEVLSSHSCFQEEHARIQELGFPSPWPPSWPRMRDRLLTQVRTFTNPSISFWNQVSEQGLVKLCTLCSVILWRIRPCVETCPSLLQETCKEEYELYFSIYNTFLHQKLEEWKQSEEMSLVHTTKCFCLNRCPPFSISKHTHSGMTQLMHKHDKPTGSKTIVLFLSDIITSAR